MPLALFVGCIIIPIVYIKYRFKDDSRFLISIFVISLIIRMSVGTIVYIHNHENGGFFSGDESVYYKKAVNIAVSWDIYGSKNIFPDTPEIEGKNFALNLLSIIEAILISAFGQSLILIRYFNSFVGALLPVSIFFLANIVFNNRTIAKTSSLFTAFFPSLIVWSSVGLKEPLIILLIINIFYFYIKNLYRFNLFPFSNFIVSIILLFYLQSNAAKIFIMIYSLQLIFLVLGKFIKKEIMVLLFILIVSYVFFTNEKVIKHKLYSLAERQTLQYIAGSVTSTRYQLYPYEKFRKYYFNFYKHLIIPPNMYSDSDIDDLKNNLKIKWANFLISFFKGLIYVIFLPLFLGIKSVSQLIIYPQIVFWWLIIPSIVYGIIWSLKFKQNETALMILFIAGIYLSLSLTEGNMGSALRHRDWVTPLCFIFGAVGINRFLFAHLDANLNKVNNEYTFNTPTK